MTLEWLYRRTRRPLNACVFSRLRILLLRVSLFQLYSPSRITFFLAVHRSNWRRWFWSIKDAYQLPCRLHPNFLKVINHSKWQTHKLSDYYKLTIPCSAPFSADSPWSRYRPLIEHMIWIDVIASVSNGKGSRLLPTYRRILKHLPTDSNMGMNRPFLQMDKIMGCDSTTVGSSS